MPNQEVTVLLDAPPKSLPKIQSTYGEDHFAGGWSRKRRSMRFAVVVIDVASDDAVLQYVDGSKLLMLGTGIII
jgi:hypothetical protein